MRSRLQAAAARGLTRFVGRDAELEQLRQALGARRGRPRARWSPSSASRASASRGSSGSSPTPIASTAGSSSRPARSPTARRRRYLPVIDLLKALLPDRATATTTADDPREGDGQAPDARPRAGAGSAGAPVRCSTCRSRTRSGRRSTRPSAGSGRWTRSSGCSCARARSSRCWWSSRTSTGSTPRPRPCSTAWSRACRPPGCCSSSTTGPSTSTRWGSKTYYTQLRLDPLPPESAEELLDAPARATTRRSQPLKRLLIERTEGNPFFLEESVRTLVETGGAGRRARRLPAGAGRSTAIQVPATVQAILAARIDRLPPEDKRLLQTAAVIGKDVPFALLQAIAERARGDAAPRARRTSRPPSSSTRRASSRTSSTRSSTR